MESRVLTRIAAIVFIAFAVTATVIEMTRQEGEPSQARPASVPHPPVDSLRAGQRRCQRRRRPARQAERLHGGTGPDQNRRRSGVQL